MKRNPVKFFLLTVMAVLLYSSCKKDNIPSKEALVSRASYNGMIAYKFSYNDKNQLARLEYYKVDPTDNSLTIYYNLTYNDKDEMTELALFEMPGNMPRARLFFGYNQSGKVINYDYYDLQGADPSSPVVKTVFTYNAQNQLSTATARDGDGEFINRYNFSYYPDGFLKQRDNYEETVTNQLRLISRVIYSIPEPNGIKGWEKFSVIPIDGDEIIRRIRYSAIQRYEYNNGVLTNHISETMGGKEYNSDGTLERQTATINYILPVNPQIINNWEYEYIIQ